eukprot:7481219-Pyramimonas_sp.AAC.1
MSSRVSTTLLAGGGPRHRPLCSARLLPVNRPPLTGPLRPRAGHNWSGQRQHRRPRQPGQSS